ncbi:MAG: redox-sensing transcriptional repressor Rex [Spirochaetaceae bacterium]|jgi:redox-sensing transcriptional repressor|nr:redox-sensing transcriptional repressor Rex [Spirochaetaceae bacterium]
MVKIRVPAAPSIRRLPSYLNIIKQAQAEGYDYISGTVIANELNLEPIQVRKDLGITGIVGKPKRGYPVAPLVVAIERFLGWDTKTGAIIVGAGNLATALTGYPQFKLHGLHFLAAFDISPEKIGTSIHGVPVYAMSEVAAIVQTMGIEIAVLTVPSTCAQETADICMQNGIKGIWNFTNVKIKAQEGVAVQREDLTSGYALLSVMLNSRHPSRIKT